MDLIPKSRHDIAHHRERYNFSDNNFTKRVKDISEGRIEYKSVDFRLLFTDGV